MFTNLLFAVIAWGTFTNPATTQQEDTSFVVEMMKDPTDFQNSVEPEKKTHWKATECAIDDKVCISEHDDRVLTLALMDGSIRECKKAANRWGCVQAVKLILDR